MEPIRPISRAPEEPNDSRYRFYETLVLWSVFPNSRGPRVKRKRTAWQRFLDDLSYLCDAETGGKSVVSIAVQQGDRILVFWISANRRLGGASQHLRWVLQQLTELYNGEALAAESRTQILEKTVTTSSRRVRNYVRALQLHILQAESVRPMTEEGNTRVVDAELRH